MSARHFRSTRRQTSEGLENTFAFVEDRRISLTGNDFEPTAATRLADLTRNLLPGD
jgi:hypothetical protein